MPALSSLSLFIASPEQVAEADQRAFLEWGVRRGLNLEQYLEEAASENQLKCSQGERKITWVLAPRDNPVTLDFFCACETFRRNALVWQRSPTRPESSPLPSIVSPPEKVICYGVASVFTPQKNRGKGYAKHMMRLLHWVLAEPSSLTMAFPTEWGTPPSRVHLVGDGRFSILWSDIGGEFYSQCGFVPDAPGWIVTNPLSTAWDVPASPSSGSSFRPTQICPDDNWSWISDLEASDLWEKDTRNMSESKLVQPSAGRAVSFVVLPGEDVAAMQHYAHRFVLGLNNILFNFWGAVRRQEREDHNATPFTSFATWTMEPESRTLLVTRIDCKPEHYAELLGIMMRVAEDGGMTSIEIYNLPEVLRETAARLGGRTFERENSLPCLKWYGKENVDEIAWLLNERYLWC